MPSSTRREEKGCLIHIHISRFSRFIRYTRARYFPGKDQLSVFFMNAFGGFGENDLLEKMGEMNCYFLCFETKN